VTSTRELVDFATDAAFEAGRFALARFQTGIEVDRKSDLSPVTAADRGAEALLRKRIEERFPHHAIVGEEMSDRVATSDSNHRWILDPIDGTRSFVHGVPLFGVLVALEVAGDPLVGVCYLPALDEMVAAGSGDGCRWNGRQARVSSVGALADALVSLTEPASLVHEHRGFFERLSKSAGTIRGYGDCYGHVLVATGRCEIMLDPVMNLWDCAALLPIVEEAGGTFTDWQGLRTIDGGSAISTNGALLPSILELMEESASR
jgi:histidinol-phosphatase